MLNFKDHLCRLEENQTPVYGIGLPEVTRTGKVIFIDHKQDPIPIRLNDGTSAFLRHDDLRRMSRLPQTGDTMTFVFLRHPNDKRQTETSTVLRAMDH